MTPETARNTFDRALRDELAGHERAEFETALENDAALCAEFEAYSDSRGGADLRAIDQWLRGAGAEAARQRPMIQPGLAESVALAAQGRRRGRLIRVAFGVAAVAAAAAIALIVMFPTQSPDEGPVYGWPNPHVGQVVMLADSARHFEKALEFAPTPGVKIEAGSGSLLRPTLEGLEVIDGEVRATLEGGATYEMRVANHRVSATGPAEFSANVRAGGEGFPQFPAPAARPGVLARFGGMGFELTVTAAKGQATVKAGETETVIAEGKSQNFKGEDDRKPPKPEELFEELDSDSDGKLTKEEAAERMIKDFDENKDGSVSLEEFKAKWRPGPPPHRVEERFRQLDRNKDGKLDVVEVEQRMIDDFDDDNSGAVELPEFRRHFRPPPEGQRPPREGGPGPEGQRPPRGPGPEGRRPPRGPGPREGDPPPPEREPR